jgi:hypothetical protein
MAYECFEGSLRRSSGIFCPLPCSRIFTVLASSSIVCLRGLLALRLSLLVDWVSLICALGFWFMWLRSPLRPFVDFEAPSVQFIWWLSLLVDWVSPICALGLWFCALLVFVASPPIEALCAFRSSFCSVYMVFGSVPMDSRELMEFRLSLMRMEALVTALSSFIR